MSEPSPPDDDTSRVWFWLVEYMASSPQIDCTTLHNLIEEAPELPSDTRERVALRCLEELFGASHAVAHELPSGTAAKVVFELSSSCEDVLEMICRETSDLRKGGPELLKWDIHPFIMHKKASMPKCSLDQLKETIIEGSGPCAALFAQFSGLVHGKDDRSRSTMEERAQREGLRRTDCQTEVSRKESIAQPPANGLAGIGENVCSGNLSSSQRGEICGDQGVVSLGRQGRGATGYCEQADTESFEQGALHTGMANDNKLVENSMQGNVRVAEEENSDLRAESQRGVIMEGCEESGLVGKDFLAAADQSGSNLCVICGKNGQLLLCDTDGCTFAIHGSCLGVTPSFDSGGQFCCPVCAHSLAISYYEKMKERVAVTLKQLSSFLHGGSENPSLEHSKRSDAEENGKPEPTGGVASVAEVNRTENLSNKEGNQRNSGGDVDEGDDYQFENGAGRLQHFPVAAHGINDKPNSEKDVADTACNSRDSGERETERTTLVCPAVRVPERRQDQDISDPSRLGDKVSEEQDQAEGETTKKVPDKIDVHQQVIPIPAVPIGVVASDERHDQTTSSNNSLRSRKREREDAVSSRTRRQKVLWTAPEENMLKEAVQKFTKSGITSWKAILEYGRSVFSDGRTAEDLRGKWKSMCKVKSPK
ncbi:hypothetical protein LINGRAHAP2_LOCUS26036 [Linum grandiflorum]